jgi:hypothetical protein
MHVMLIMTKVDISSAANIFTLTRCRGGAGERASAVAAQGSRVRGLVKWAVK